jgi:hypothetical protein
MRFVRQMIEMSDTQDLRPVEEGILIRKTKMAILPDPDGAEYFL